MTETNAPIYFFGKDKPNGWLSQFYDSPFTYCGVTYNNNEQFFQAAKAFHFDDEKSRQAIVAAKTPSEAKTRGKKVRPFDEDSWDEVSADVAILANYLKFTRSRHATELRDKLLATGERELVEASPRDRTWGIGFGAENADRNRDQWGRNLLGRVLMEVRRRLVLEQQTKDRRH